MQGAQKVVMDMAPDLRKCLPDGAGGWLLVLTKIDAQGTVTSATPVGTPNLAPDAVACITSRIQRAQFPSLAGNTGGAVFRIPLRFGPSGAKPAPGRESPWI